MPRSSILNSYIKELQSCVEYIKSYCGDEKEGQLEIIKRIAKDYSEAMIQESKEQQARKAVENYLNNNNSVEDVQQLFNRFLEEQTSSTYETHPIWTNINSFIEGTDGNADVSDVDFRNDTSVDEGIVPSQFKPPIDPITKMIIQNPHKNKVCGHVYEYDAIMDHLKHSQNNKTKICCPYLGCVNKNMRKSVIVRDRKLQQQIQDYQANVSNTTAIDDADESVL